MNILNSEKIGTFIAKLRKEKKMTQEDLAELLHTDRSMVSKFERGIHIPKMDMLLELSKIFGVTINELYYGEKINKINKNEINSIPIKIMKKEKKKYKTLLALIVIAMVLLIISFLTYYFFNNYNSIKVYKVSGESENFGIYDGIIVLSREKSYIQLGKIEELHEEKIESIRVYYLKNDVEYDIFTNNNSSQLFINDFSHSISYSYKDFKYIMNNLYIETLSNKGTMEKMKLSVEIDFTNNSITNKNEGSLVDVDIEIEYTNVPLYIKKNFELQEKEEKYYLESKENDLIIKQSYYYNNKLFIVEMIGENHTAYFEYYYPNEISYYIDSNDISTYDLLSSKCISEKCDENTILKFKKDYIDEIDFNK